MIGEMDIKQILFLRWNNMLIAQLFVDPKEDVFITSANTYCFCIATTLYSFVWYDREEDVIRTCKQSLTEYIMSDRSTKVVGDFK
jgi:hypothetical protein